MVSLPSRALPSISLPQIPTLAQSRHLSPSKLSDLIKSSSSCFTPDEKAYFDKVFQSRKSPLRITCISCLRLQEKLLDDWRKEGGLEMDKPIEALCCRAFTRKETSDGRPLITQVTHLSCTECILFDQQCAIPLPSIDGSKDDNELVEVEHERARKMLMSIDWAKVGGRMSEEEIDVARRRLLAAIRRGLIDKRKEEDESGRRLRVDIEGREEKGSSGDVTRSYRPPIHLDGPFPSAVPSDSKSPSSAQAPALQLSPRIPARANTLPGHMTITHPFQRTSPTISTSQAINSNSDDSTGERTERPGPGGSSGIRDSRPGKAYASHKDNLSALGIRQRRDRSERPPTRKTESSPSESDEYGRAQRRSDSPHRDRGKSRTRSRSPLQQRRRLHPHQGADRLNPASPSLLSRMEDVGPSRDELDTRGMRRNGSGDGSLLDRFDDRFAAEPSRCSRLDYFHDGTLVSKRKNESNADAERRWLRDTWDLELGEPILPFRLTQRIPATFSHQLVQLCLDGMSREDIIFELGRITKSCLTQRDMDLLKNLAKSGRVRMSKSKLSLQSREELALKAYQRLCASQAMQVVEETVDTGSMQHRHRGNFLVPTISSAEASPTARSSSKRGFSAPSPTPATIPQESSSLSSSLANSQIIDHAFFSPDVMTRDPPTHLSAAADQDEMEIEEAMLLARETPGDNHDVEMKMNELNGAATFSDSSTPGNVGTGASMGHRIAETSALGEPSTFFPFIPATTITSIIMSTAAPVQAASTSFEAILRQLEEDRKWVEEQTQA